jgi:hypothetical protein
MQLTAALRARREIGVSGTACEADESALTVYVARGRRE